MTRIRLLLWSLLAGVAGAAVFTAIGQLARIVLGRCDALCKLSVSIPYGFMGGLLVIFLLERDRRARERSLEP